MESLWLVTRGLQAGAKYPQQFAFVANFMKLTTKIEEQFGARVGQLQVRIRLLSVVLKLPEVPDVWTQRVVAFESVIIYHRDCIVRLSNYVIEWQCLATNKIKCEN